MLKLIRDRRFLGLAIVAAIAAAAGGAIAQTTIHRSRERVRIVRGSFDYNGNILAGAGFSVEIEQGGDLQGNPGLGSLIYHIRFDAPFRSAPTTQASLGIRYIYSGDGGNYRYTDAVSFDSIDGSQATSEPRFNYPAVADSFDLVSAEYSFIAVGP